MKLSSAVVHQSPPNFLVVDQIDLGPIMFKLMDKKDGEGWTRDRVVRCEREYKRFLTLNLKHRGKSIVPTKEIDIFWHYHILDTQKYFEDCKILFGGYFHHFPYFGMRGEEDAADLNRAFEETKFLYESEFGETYIGSANQCANACDTPCEGGNDSSMRATDCANACRTPCEGGNDVGLLRTKKVNSSVRPTFN